MRPARPCPNECGASILWLPGVHRPVEARVVPYAPGMDGAACHRRLGWRLADTLDPPPREVLPTHHCPRSPVVGSLAHVDPRGVLHR